MAAAIVARPTGNHRGHANARDDHSKSQGEFNLKEELAIGQAHAASGVDNGGIHPLDAGVGVANERQQGVESEREDGEAVGAGSNPGGGQKESEERKAGDGLNNVRRWRELVC